MSFEIKAGMTEKQLIRRYDALRGTRETQYLL